MGISSADVLEDRDSAHEAGWPLAVDAKTALREIGTGVHVTPPSNRLDLPELGRAGRHMGSTSFLKEQWNES
jgi:hypothetical protein